MGLGFLLPNLAEVLMLTKQSDLCGEADAACELSLPGENKFPKYTAPESATKPARRQHQHETSGMQVRIYSTVIAALCIGYLGLAMAFWMLPLLNFIFSP